MLFVTVFAMPILPLISVVVAISFVIVPGPVSSIMFVMVVPVVVVMALFTTTTLVLTLSFGFFGCQLLFEFLQA